MPLIQKTDRGIPLCAWLVAVSTAFQHREPAQLSPRYKTQLPTPNSQLPAPNSQLPTPNSQPPSSQLPTINSKIII